MTRAHLGSTPQSPQRRSGGGVCADGADAKSDEFLWNAKVEDYSHSCYESPDPLIADDKVRVTRSGGWGPLPLAAFETETGKPLRQPRGYRRSGAA